MKQFNKGRPRWSDLEYLIADLFPVWTKKPHPARPKAVTAASSGVETERRARIRRQHSMRKRQQRKIAGRN